MKYEVLMSENELRLFSEYQKEYSFNLKRNLKKTGLSIKRAIRDVKRIGIPGKTPGEIVTRAPHNAYSFAVSHPNTLVTQAASTIGGNALIGPAYNALPVGPGSLATGRAMKADKNWIKKHPKIEAHAKRVKDRGLNRPSKFRQHVSDGINGFVEYLKTLG